MAIESNLFDFENSTGNLTFYFDVNAGEVENRSLYFTRNSTFHFSESTFLLGVISFVGGSFEEGIFDLIFDSKRAEIESYAGYVQEPEDDTPFEFSSTFNSPNGLEAHHHIVRDTGCGYAMVLTLLTGFVDSDIEEILQLTSRFKFKELGKLSPYGEILPIRFTSQTDQSKVGSRLLISSPELAS